MYKMADVDSAGNTLRSMSRSVRELVELIEFVELVLNPVRSFSKASRRIRRHCSLSVRTKFLKVLY